MAFDSARGRTVLFGGQGGTGAMGDTWEWDGNVWVQRASSGPPARYYHGMAYDPVRARTVIASGVPSGGGSYQDIWEWDGTTWLQRGASPAIGQARLCYDSLRHRVVGLSLSASPLAVWDYDGTTTSTRSIVGGTPVPPGGRNGAAFDYDANRDRVLLAAGILVAGATGLSDTWELAPSGASWAWTQRTPIGTPRAYVAGAFDLARGRLVVFGGIDAGTPRGETLTFPWLPLLRQPQAAGVPVGQAAQFSVQTCDDAACAFQWRRAGTPLANGGNISGATQPTLTISGVSAADAAAYDVLITDPCGSVTASQAAALSLTQPCYANCDGSTAAPILNVNDFSCFLQKYVSGCP